MSVYAITKILFEKAVEYPDKDSFIFLDDDLSPFFKLTYRELGVKVKARAESFSKLSLNAKNVLLLYPDNAEFIISFLACQLAGIIPIPMFPPKGKNNSERLLKIIDDASVDCVFTISAISDRIRKSLQNVYKKKLSVIETDLLYAEADGEALVDIPSVSTSFIQYTSGSTGDPKGVVITHNNLLHNQRLLVDAFGCNEKSVIFSWLPFYHDMGLIGNILHSIFVGATCILSSPYSFIQKPSRWLETITKYKVTHSGGPNFAYDLCTDSISRDVLDTYDLSSWKVAYNGSEPIRLETIERFSEFFERSGFKKSAFCPCYGLAEATLIVSGNKPGDDHKIINIDTEQLKNGLLNQTPDDDRNAKKIISSGKVLSGMEVKIINNKIGKEKMPLLVGEICIAGESVSNGYWKEITTNSIEKRETTEYFSTGDIGFIYEGHLFVTGRIKEMLIIRGKNFYPSDIENCIRQTHEAIERNGMAAFSVEVDGYSELVVIVEMKRKYLNLDEKAKSDIISKIEMNIVHETGIRPYRIVLTNPMQIPRTSSGKIKRLQCATLYTNNKLEQIFSSGGSKNDFAEKETYSVLISAVRSDASAENIKSYLKFVFSLKLPLTKIDFSNDELELIELGIDSLKAMELINTINKDLQLNLDSTVIYHDNTLSGLLTAVEMMLWLNTPVKGRKITI